MVSDADRIIGSRSDLRSPVEAVKPEDEGGCGVVGLASTVRVRGYHILCPVEQMHNRGNGKGGGVAAVGLVPEQMRVPTDVLKSHYLLQIAYLDEASRPEVEREFVHPHFDVHTAYAVENIDDHTALGLDVKPPLVWRYFARVKPVVLNSFVREKGLAGLEARQAEDEFVFQNTYRLNTKFYASLGEKRAFVLSHGRNMFVFKIVGFAEQCARYYKLEDVRAHVWIGHQRYPTKGRVWHPGGAHPFIGLDEALVHNGDFANYHSVVEYLKQRNIHPLFLTDTEVSVLLFDLLKRVYGYPLEYVIEAMAPTTERDFTMLPPERQRIYRMIQAVHIHGSPDGPWFFIIGRNDREAGAYQLIGITDTSMLRPQVFALQEGEVSIGLISSEKQAIDASPCHGPEGGPCLDRDYHAPPGSELPTRRQASRSAPSHPPGGAFRIPTVPPGVRGGADVHSLGGPRSLPSAEVFRRGPHRGCPRVPARGRRWPPPVRRGRVPHGVEASNRVRPHRPAGPRVRARGGQPGDPARPLRESRGLPRLRTRRCGGARARERAGPDGANHEGGEARRPRGPRTDIHVRREGGRGVREGERSGTSADQRGGEAAGGDQRDRPGLPRGILHGGGPAQGRRVRRAERDPCAGRWHGRGSRDAVSRREPVLPRLGWGDLHAGPATARRRGPAERRAVRLPER